MGHYDSSKPFGTIANKSYLGLLVEARQVPSQYLLDPTVCTLLQCSSVAAKMVKETDNNYDKKSRQIIIPVFI